MNSTIIKYVLIVFGLLDLYAFVINLQSISYIEKSISFGLSNSYDSEDYIFLVLFPILMLILVLSLLATGILSILGKKWALIIYYFQFPLRFLFVVLTFSIFFRFFKFQVDSIAYQLLVWFLMALEIARLAFSIWVHRRMISNKK